MTLHLARLTTWRRIVGSVALFPIIVTALFVMLVAADINGSSIGILHAGKHDPALLTGTPRGIRADEYAITTPLAISDARQGFPTDPLVGMTETEQTAIPHGAPTKQWSEVFKPHDWGYLVLGPARGLAVHWWLPVLLALLGIYWLLLSLGFDALTSAALSVATTMTPYNAWWTAPSSVVVVGYATLAAAACCRAVSATTSAARAAYGAAAGAATTALVLTLYPPWVLSVGLVAAAVVVGYAFDARPRLRALVLPVAGFLVVLVPSLTGWYLQNRGAIKAITATYYPGHRLSKAGEASFAYMLDAPLNPLFAGSAGGSLRTTGVRAATNLSETSAGWLPLPLLLAGFIALVVLVVRRRPAQTVDAEERSAVVAGPWTAAAVTVVLVVLGCWAILPLPDWTGSLFLDRVKGTRVPEALALAGVLLLAIVGSRRPGRPNRLVAAGWATAAVATVVLTVWSARQIPWDQARAPLFTVVVLALLVAVPFALIGSGWFPRVGAAVLAVFAFWSWALVNPLYHGLGPLSTDTLTKAMRSLPGVHTGDRVEVFGKSRTIALVRAAGLQVASGVTFYPNVAIMESLAPNQPHYWNNYIVYTWVPDPAAPVPIHQIHGTSMELHVSPCDPRILTLGIKWAVADRELHGSCLDPVDVVHSRAGNFYRYRVH